jgi:hypothetical protein
VSGETRDDPFLALRRLVSTFQQQPTSRAIGMLREEAVLLARLLHDHDAMCAHLMACTRCEPTQQGVTK